MNKNEATIIINDRDGPAQVLVVSAEWVRSSLIYEKKLGELQDVLRAVTGQCLAALERAHLSERRRTGEEEKKKKGKK